MGGGTGVVAMLVGENAVLSLEHGLRATHMEHVYDFYKPDLLSEFPEVDGPLTVECYLRAVDNCYQRYMEKLRQLEGVEDVCVNNLDYMVLHTPYTKLVQKSFGRLYYNDFLRNPDKEIFYPYQRFMKVSQYASYFDRELEKAFMSLSKHEFTRKVEPSLMAARQLGNMYCGSLYAGLISLLVQTPSSELMGKRIGMFAYGSGLSATMFSFRVRQSTSRIARAVNLSERLEQRIIIPPAEFEKIMNLREETHQNREYHPVGDVQNMFLGTYYLEYVDQKFRRSYKRVS